MSSILLLLSLLSLLACVTPSIGMWIRACEPWHQRREPFFPPTDIFEYGFVYDARLYTSRMYPYPLELDRSGLHREVEASRTTSQKKMVSMDFDKLQVAKWMRTRGDWENGDR